MRRIILAVLLLACVGSAWAYDANTISVLEFENNVTDSIGNTWIAWTNTSGVPFSNTVVKFGTYSAGVFDVGKYITSGGSKINPKTIEAWVYLPSSVTWTTKQTIWRSTTSGEELSVLLSTNAITYKSTLAMGILVRDTWTHLAVTYDGVTTRAYTNGIYQGLLNNTYLPTGLVPIGGTNATLNPWPGYIDRLVMSDIVRTSFPSDDPFTPTPTLTATPTVTPTFTVTPTITPTATPTQTPWPDYFLNNKGTKDPHYQGPRMRWYDYFKRKR